MHDWMERANCLGTDPEEFFPGPGQHGEVARGRCAACTVSAECLDLAVRREAPGYVYGIYGGLSAAQRGPLVSAARC